MKYFKRFTLLFLVALLGVFATANTTFAADTDEDDDTTQKVDEWREVELNLSDRYRTYLNDGKLYFVNAPDYKFQPTELTQTQSAVLEASGDLEHGLYEFLDEVDFYIEIFDEENKKLDKVESQNVGQFLYETFNNYFESKQTPRIYIDLNTYYEPIAVEGTDPVEYQYDVRNTKIQYLKHYVNFFKLNEKGDFWYLDHEYISANYEAINFLSYELLNAFDNQENPLGLFNRFGFNLNIMSVYNDLFISKDGVESIQLQPILVNDTKHLYNNVFTFEKNSNGLTAVTNQQLQTPAKENSKNITIINHAGDTRMILDYKDEIITEPTKEGYKFLGYFYHDGNQVDLENILFESTNLPHNHQTSIFYAKWELIDETKYDILYDELATNKAFQHMNMVSRIQENILIDFANGGYIKVANRHFEGGTLDGANNTWNTGVTFVKDNSLYFIIGGVVLLGAAILLFKKRK